MLHISHCVCVYVYVRARAWVSAFASVLARVCVCVWGGRGAGERACSFANPACSAPP